MSTLERLRFQAHHALSSQEDIVTPESDSSVAFLSRFCPISKVSQLLSIGSLTITNACFWSYNLDFILFFIDRWLGLAKAGLKLVTLLRASGDSGHKRVPLLRCVYKSPFFNIFEAC